MNEPLAPHSIAPAAANYALAMSTVGATAWLHTSGIVGTRPDGTIADDIGEQAQEVWRSVGTLLGEGGFEVTDIVSYTTYAVAGHDLAAVMAARDGFLGEHVACSTLVPVPALARPEWTVEVSVIAAR